MRDRSFDVLVDIIIDYMTIIWVIEEGLWRAWQDDPLNYKKGGGTWNDTGNIRTVRHSAGVY